MRFDFTAGGNPAETLTSLRNLSPADLGNDRAGIVMRDIIAQAISECSADLESHQVYSVTVSGDSSGTHGFTLHARVELGDRLNYTEPVPAPLPR